MEKSRYAEWMMTHDTRNIRSVVESFKGREAPAILVSPSVVTGWDFPGDTCRWQLIAKLGFPDSRSEVVRARQEHDPEWVYYYTMQTLVQACGRGCRAPDDWCVCMVIDDNFTWFMRRYSHFAPQWFLDAVKWSNTIPQPYRVNNNTQ
jgi:Rad3-related DNA helicase